MVLPLSLLQSAASQPVMVEVKSGESYSGILTKSDPWMNLRLSDAVCTSKEGDKFWRLTEVFIRGNGIKLMRLPEEVGSCALRVSSCV